MEKLLTVYSHNNIPIRLSDERWIHITTRHPEMLNLKQEVLETLARPDMIQQGDFGEQLAIRFYCGIILNNKFLVVA